MGNYEKFRQLLTEYLDANEISLGELARKANIDQSYIYKIKSGDRNPPSREIILRISRVLNLRFQEENELLFLAGYAPLRYVDALSSSTGTRVVSQHDSVTKLQSIVGDENLEESDLELINLILDRVKRNLTDSSDS